MTVEWFGEKILEQVNSVAAKVSKEIAEDVMKDAKAILKRTATTTTERGLLSQFYVAKSKFKNGGYLVYCQGPKKWYKPYHASFLEMGSWVFPYGNKKRRKVYLPPKPFMRPAANKNRRKAAKQYKDALLRELDKE